MTVHVPLKFNTMRSVESIDTFKEKKNLQKMKILFSSSVKSKVQLWTKLSWSE